MELYKREKVNPLTGCLPMLIQIPVFFSLYKVLFVTIEMYHAPFYRLDQGPVGARSDLVLQPVRPDALHRAAVPPQFLMILLVGVWPIMMGITQCGFRPRSIRARPIRCRRKMFALDAGDFHLHVRDISRSAW